MVTLTANKEGNSEKYINLTTQLQINKNVCSVPELARTYHLKGFKTGIWSFKLLIAKVLEKYKHIFGQKEVPNLFRYAVVKCSASIDWDKTHNFLRWKASYGLQGIVNGYAESIKQGDTLPPPVLIDINNVLYQIDGSKRLLAHLVASNKVTDILILTPRSGLHRFIDSGFIQRVRAERAKVKWFPNYQGVVELNLTGTRNYDHRFGTVYDFSILDDRTVVDFGCNFGQASLEAYFSGARQVFGLDVQVGCISSAQLTAKRLGVPVSYQVADFNRRKEFYESTLEVVPTWDYALFLAIYRTKELVAREELFEFIVKHTRRGIFFEGHGAAIDRDDFYGPIFDSHNLRWKRIGRSDSRPAYLLEKRT